MYRVDVAHSGHAPDRTGPVDGVTEKWVVEIPDAFRSTPAVTNGTVFACDGTKLRRFGSAEGVKRGTQETGPLNSSPAVVDGTAYVGGGNWVLYALQPDSLLQGWHYGTNGAVSSPAVDGETVYVGSTDGHLYALTAPEGEAADEWQPEGVVKWSFEAEGRVYGSGNKKHMSAPAVADGTVFVNTFDKLYALSTEDGTEKWSLQTGRGAGTPAVVNGTVYVIDNKLYALSAIDGTEQWSVSVENAPPVAVADGLVYLNGETFQALDAADGTVVWESSIGGGSRISGSAPVLDSGTAYVGTNGALHAVDAADGSQQWSYEQSGKYFGTPSIADSELYVVTIDSLMTGGDGGEVMALEETDG